MSGSITGIVVIIIVAVIGLVTLETLVLAAARTPYFKHPHPEWIWRNVRGGVHLGDPRSLEAPHGQPMGTEGLHSEAPPAQPQTPPGPSGAPPAQSGG